FGLDVRALAVLRIALGLLLLASLADRAREFTAFYTDAGVLSRVDILSGARFAPWDGASWLHPFGWLPDRWSSIALFVAATVSALSLLVGKQTRASCFLAWSMLTGLDNRNPLVVNAGDDLLRMLLFWSLFLPLSALSRSRRDDRVVSAGTVAFFIQLSVTY